MAPTKYEAYKNINNVTSDGTSSNEYHIDGVLLMAFLQGMAQLGPFWGCLFGIWGKDGEWTVAWWSFCFFGSVIPQVLNLLFNEPAKIFIHLKEKRRAGGTIEHFNYFGTPLYKGEAHPLSVDWSHGTLDGLQICCLCQDRRAHEPHERYAQMVCVLYRQGVQSKAQGRKPYKVPRGFWIRQGAPCQEQRGCLKLLPPPWGHFMWVSFCEY